MNDKTKEAVADAAETVEPSKDTRALVKKVAKVGAAVAGVAAVAGAAYALGSRSDETVEEIVDNPVKSPKDSNKEK